MNPVCRQREACSVQGENDRYKNERQKESEQKVQKGGQKEEVNQGVKGEINWDEVELEVKNMIKEQEEKEKNIMKGKEEKEKNMTKRRKRRRRI